MTCLTADPTAPTAHYRGGGKTDEKEAFYDVMSVFKNCDIQNILLSLYLKPRLM
jgi:hypothetical protein